MGATTKDTTCHLIIIPAEIKKEMPFLCLLTITKSAGKTDYRLNELDSHFQKYLPAELRKHLQPLTEHHLTYDRYHHQTLHAKQRTGHDLDTYLRRQYLRYCQHFFKELKSHAGIHKFYHRTKGSQGSTFLNAPCRISEYTPTLHFEVEKSDGGLLSVIPTFSVNGIELPKESCKVHGFLLQHEHEYHILSLNDTLMLDWLSDKRPEQYAKDPQALSRVILSRLEEKYTVNRNGHFPVTEIRAQPENVLLLSEISKSFLMLTPQWKYDDILVEGKFKPRHELHINGEMFVVYRDEAAEKAFNDYLRKLHPSFLRQINGHHHLSFEEARKKNWFLKAFHEWLEKDIQLMGMDMLSNFRYSTFPIETEIRLVNERKGALELFIRVRFGKEETSLTELKKLLIAKQQYILLKDNTMGVLTEDWVKEYGVIIKHGRIQQNTVTLPSWILVALRNRDEKPSEWKKAFSNDWWSRWLQWQDDAEPVAPLPSGLQAELRPYQQKGFEWLSLLCEIGGGGLLADDMGLGKTLQAITLLLHLKERQDNPRFLVITPTSLMVNWQRELEKFAPELRVQVFHQQQRKLDSLMAGETDVVITSYGTARSATEELGLIAWNLIILDESHHIKNASTLTAKAIGQLNADSRIALSGTPLMNNTEELYSQLNFLLPGLLGSPEFFRKEYAHPIDREQDADKIKALQRITRPFILRRTKNQVATDLPEKIETVIWCNMTAQQANCYQMEEKRARKDVYHQLKEKGLQQSRMNVLQAITRLRQICSLPSIAKDLESPTEESVKLDLLLEEIKGLGGHKALVFSQFKGVLFEMSRRLKQDGILHYHFDGDTPPAERHQLVEAFQEEGNPVNIFLMSLMTGNAGFNLTKADYVFLVDPWWNKAVLDQAIDRTHRIGQDKTVFAYKMICRNTIEERILQLQERKQGLSDDIISEESGFAKQLTEEDIHFLFGQ